MTRRRYPTLLTAFGLLALYLGACAPAVTSNPSQLTFNPVDAFAGRSHGNGTLEVIFQAPQPFHVESRGLTQANGTFRLEQTVKFAGKPPQKRYWLLKKVSPTGYGGTLSDAAGPVTGQIEGPQFRLEYALPGDLTMHQTLTLEPGGKTIDNVGRITFLGVQVGYLHETIERKDAVKQRQLKGVNSALVRTALAKPVRRE